tara:strand:- start:1782 stop:1934 length:153 start_codon:yes stop_codon:yes gene_type:complete
MECIILVLEKAPFIDPLTAISVISYSLVTTAMIGYSGYNLSSQKPKEKKE